MMFRVGAKEGGLQAIPCVLLCKAQTKLLLLDGQRILVQGAAGQVGSFAVQLAKAVGATVFATAAATDRARMLELGAEVVIDYETERFEDRAQDMDIVLAFVGGETLERSWAVLAPSGVLISCKSGVAGRRACGTSWRWFNFG